MLNQTILVRIFKGCLSQSLLDPFLNTLSRLNTLSGMSNTVLFSTNQIAGILYISDKASSQTYFCNFASMLFRQCAQFLRW